MRYYYLTKKGKQFMINPSRDDLAKVVIGVVMHTYKNMINYGIVPEYIIFESIKKSNPEYKKEVVNNDLTTMVDDGYIKIVDSKFERYKLDLKGGDPDEAIPKTILLNMFFGKRNYKNTNILGFREHARTIASTIWTIKEAIKSKKQSMKESNNKQ